MTKTIAPVAALLLSVAILLTGNGLQGTLLPVRAQLEAFTTLDIGILGSAYYLGFAAGCFYSPLLVRRVGHIRAFTAMSAVASAAVLIHAVYTYSWVWWVVRAITGFCFAALYAVIESWLNERATNETRGAIMSAYLIIQLTVITIGQMMITLSDPAQFPLFAMASILVSVAAVPVAMTAAAAPAPIEQVKVRIGHLIRVSPVGFAGSFAHGMAGGAFWSLAPVFAVANGMDVTGIAVFMSITVIGGAIGQYPMGRLSDRTDRRSVLIFVCAGAALAAFGMMFFRFAGLQSLYAYAVLWGFFAFPLYAIAVAHANDFADPKEFVEVSSGLLLVYGAGAVIGPVIASEAIERFGADGLFGTTATVHLVLIGFVIWRMRARAAPEEHGKFIESLCATNTASATFDIETHPRSESEAAAFAPPFDSPADTGSGSDGSGEGEPRA
ncbi:MAG: MFS transporter [Gammaproteobacteria bacterium]|nr:MFS transporter [Gammaproteobacteria bacterium]